MFDAISGCGCTLYSQLHSYCTALKMAQDGTFLYFSFGSYMSSARIHQFCPTASFVSIGQVYGKRVRFCAWSESWKGAGSTMVEGGEVVWGVVWRLDRRQLTMLDR